MQDRGALADFETFYERTYPAAFRVAYGVLGERHLAEDVTQDAYVSAYRDRQRYRGDGPPEAWLYRIVVHAAISAARRRRIRMVSIAEPGPPCADGVDETARATDRLAIGDALGHLDPRARSAVILRYYLDLDYATIAGILGTSADNVGVILTRSLARLRDVMEPPPGAPGVITAKEAGRNG